MGEKRGRIRWVMERFAYFLAEDMYMHIRICVYKKERRVMVNYIPSAPASSKASVCTRPSPWAPPETTMTLSLRLNSGSKPFGPRTVGSTPRFLAVVFSDLRLLPLSWALVAAAAAGELVVAAVLWRDRRSPVVGTLAGKEDPDLSDIPRAAAAAAAMVHLGDPRHDDGANKRAPIMGAMTREVRDVIGVIFSSLFLLSFFLSFSYLRDAISEKVQVRCL